ncbi:MAG TPA: acyl-CoA dehydrogenase family protein [Thermomicrobiales bacterium]|nr:acyl-CoA dehydrogenase family protein [Thermomicrobiales bacterium]HRA31692.1 acyl-CoA dehydrogenase family protein [Thermomicrobiales bacterium]
MVTRFIPACWRPSADLVDIVRGLTPLADDIDGCFARGEPNDEAIAVLARAGLLGLTLPTRYGGQGRDYTALAAVCEELGAIDTSHQVSLTVHLALAAMCMFQWGSEAQRDQWLPALARGERIGTFGLTEPGAGSDVGALRMRAHRVPGGYEISGEKSWISATNQATLFILFATIDPALRHKGITAFIVPRESAGLSTTVLNGKLGLRAGDTGAVVCDRVYVPDAAVLGRPGEGFAVALSALGNGLFTVGCGALGIARACREWTAGFLRDAGDDGRGLDGALLAAMVAREESARLLLARAASRKNDGMPNASETGLAKWRAAEAGFANASDALTIWNSRAAGEQPTLLRHLFNAKGAVIYGGTSEIHQTMQGAYALGDRVERPFRCPSPSARDLR